MSPMIGAEAQAATVDVGRKRAADREPIGAGLLLRDSPLAGLPGAGPEQVVDELGPVDPRLDGHESTFVVEFKDTRQARHVEKNSPVAELLAAHRVASARDADPIAGGRGVAHDMLQRAHGIDPDHPANRRAIQLCVHVVDLAALARRRRVTGGWRCENQP